MRGWYAIRRRRDGMWLAGCRKAVKVNAKGSRHPLVPSYEFSPDKKRAVHYKQGGHAKFMWHRVSKRFPKEMFEILFETDGWSVSKTNLTTK